MTLNGAIKQLHELRTAEDMPIYYKPAIAEVINVLLMDTQEVKHGWWKKICHPWYECSECGERTAVVNLNGEVVWNYCPDCGAKMDLTE